MLCKVTHCARHVSTIPGLISCAGMTRRWGLISHAQNDQRNNISVKKSDLDAIQSHLVGRAPFGHITGLTSCTGLASYQGPCVGELGTHCLCMCQVPLVTWIPLPPTRAWERDKVGVFCEVHQHQISHTKSSPGHQNT